MISSAAGVMMTELFGDNFSFVDVVEVKYGLPERRFNSFQEALGSFRKFQIGYPPIVLEFVVTILSHKTSKQSSRFVHAHILTKIHSTRPIMSSFL